MFLLLLLQLLNRLGRACDNLQEHLRKCFWARRRIFDGWGLFVTQNMYVLGQGQAWILFPPRT